jgi:hypothetical protein
LRVIALTKAGAVNGRSLRAELGALFQRSKHCLRWDEKEEVLGRLGKSSEVGIATRFPKLGIIWIHEIDLPLIASSFEILKNECGPAALG